MSEEEIVPGLLHDPGTGGQRPWAMRYLSKQGMHGMSLALALQPKNVNHKRHKVHEGWGLASFLTRCGVRLNISLRIHKGGAYHASTHVPDCYKYSDDA